ncbi:MAG: flavin reductase family protein [Pseudomonadota bacterium]
MFYKPSNGHGLPHDPFKALIAPRPIAWVSTRGNDGTENLAPYSFFNAVAFDPPILMFSSTQRKADREKGKDTVGNIIDTGVFCVNLVSHAQRDAMNTSSAAVPREVDEFDLAGLDRQDCETIACSRVSFAPACLECDLLQTLDLPGEANIVVFGQVTGIHLRDEYLVDGIFDVTRFQLLARMGYRDYTSVSEVFELNRPKTV